MTRFDQQMKDLAYSILHEDEREQGDAEHHIQELEKRIGVPLPTDYREFLTRYGGATFSDTFEAPLTEPGHFDEYACPEVFFGFYKPEGSGRPHSLDLPDNLRFYKSRIPKGFIPIARAIGGNLILLGVDARNRGRVYYWDHETSDVLAVADTVADFLANLRITDEEDEDED